MIIVTMPAFASEMESGEIRWLRRVGEEVAEGDVIAEVDAEKVTFELEAPAAGRIAEILYPTGTEIPVGTVIVLIEESLAGRS